MDLVKIARQTLQIIQQGGYAAPSGRRVDVGTAIAHAVERTVLYRPDDFGAVATLPGIKPCIEVTGETTGAAARRVVGQEGPGRVAVLNFASAKNPGGGFLRGTKAQEEDLARCSALYPCLDRQRAYYDANRACSSMIYTDHIIYSPDVPFFFDEQYDLLEQPFLASIITAPAPNAGEALRRDPGAGPIILEALRTRAAKILQVGVAQARRVVILGAWGCGVFRNDPADVADAFANLLAGPFRGNFDRVVFPVYESKDDGPNRRTFMDRLSRDG